MPTLTLDIDPRGVARLTLARPERHNAMDAAMLDQLTAAAATLQGNDAVRVVVIGGRGGSFCAGADLGWMKGNLGRSREERIAESHRLSRMLRGFADLPCPVIARVHGAAFGGGLGLIAVGDIAIGVHEARFCLSEVRLGLAPSNISPYIIRRMGLQNARRCMLSAHEFQGEEAVTLGLLDRVVAPAELEAAVEREITAALRCAPAAVAATKTLIDRVAAMTPDTAMAYTGELLADLWEGDEAREGIEAFFAKRAPRWAC